MAQTRGCVDKVEKLRQHGHSLFNFLGWKLRAPVVVAIDTQLQKNMNITVCATSLTN